MCDLFLNSKAQFNICRSS